MARVRCLFMCCVYGTEEFMRKNLKYEKGFLLLMNCFDCGYLNNSIMVLI